MICFSRIWKTPCFCPVSRGQLLGLLFALLLGPGETSAILDAPPPYADLILSAIPGFTGPAWQQPLDVTLDFGPHPDTQHDLWHIYGRLQSPEGSIYGISLTFLRAGVMSSSHAETTGSAWRMRDMMLGRIELTEAATTRMWTDSRVSRVALGLAGADKGLLQRVWINDWQLEYGPAAKWRCSATTNFGVLSLAGSSPHLVGGVDTGGPVRGYTLALVNLAGHLLRANSSVPLTGQLWLERVWGQVPVSTGPMASTRLALHLNDGRDLLLTVMQRRTGQAPSIRQGTLRDTTGHTKVLASRDIKVSTLGVRDTPDGKARYPTGWHVTIAAATFDANVTTVAELMENTDWPRHWSSPVIAKGLAGEPIAEGFVQQVGYAAE